MYDIQQLMDILGYSRPHQVRERLDLFKPVLGRSLKRGSKNKILVDHNGLEILRRAKALEETGLTLKDVANTLKEELETGHANGGTDETETASNSLTLVLEEKDRRLRQMESEIEFLRRQVLRLEDLIQSRLPELPPPDEAPRAGRPSRWQRLRQFIKGQ